jgi:probable F420-dependent oxidoreductase
MSAMLGHFSLWKGQGPLPLPDGYAAAVEAAGFRRLWVASPSADLQNIEHALAETENLWLASGVLNIWSEDAHETAASYHRLEERYPGRFVLGVGAGHRERNAEYDKPYEALQRYLDVLDAEGVPLERRVLAALGPRVMALAGERSAGAHPYLTTPQHTATARTILGHGKLLIPEQTVVPLTDVDAARALARDILSRHLDYVNYRNNWLRSGFTQDDLADGGSDAFIDAVIAHGSLDAVAARAGEHLLAGADEVCVQPLSGAKDFHDELHTLGDALSRWQSVHSKAEQQPPRQ